MAQSGRWCQSSTAFILGRSRATAPVLRIARRPKLSAASPLSSAHFGALPRDKPYDLFPLHGLDVVHQVCDAQVYKLVIRSANRREQRSPYRHLRVAMRRLFHTVTKHVLDVTAREFTVVALSECCQVRWRGFKVSRQRAVAL